jgi:hypothetical protein
VIGSKQQASKAIAEFDYQNDRAYKPLPVHEFKLLPDTFFHTSPSATSTSLSSRSRTLPTATDR